MSKTETALTVQMVSPRGEFDDARLASLCAELRDRFGIAHSTIQMERGDGECWQVPSGVV
jgi:cobalt-zinc-cadmium efflux system protein